jgi:uncharacterized protein (DUF1684 family)
MAMAGSNDAVRTAVSAFGVSDALDLLDWKRRIFALYGEVRAAADPQDAWGRWQAVREQLYRSHPQSPLVPEDRLAYRSSFFDYDPAFRVFAEVHDAAAAPSPIPSSIGGTFAFSRIGTASFELDGQECELEVHWNDGYGGGILVVVADETSGEETYGGGRYVLDTVKGADLGYDRNRLVLDFNFAFNPSCAFDPRWACPLAPAANRLPIRVEAGEQAP